MKIMINDNNKNSWCVNAFHAMSANNNGTTKICCMIKHDDEESSSLQEDTIENNFNQPIFLDVRNSLANGIRHERCKWCWQEEDAGRKSKRLRDNEVYRHMLEKGEIPYHGLTKLELNLGNTCNLKCRTCDTYSSSQWIKEKFDIYEHKNYKNNFKIYAQSQKQYHMTYDEDSPLWDDIENNLDTIRQLDFYGGEPFMNNKMWHLLEVCVERNLSKKIDLHYATNATHWPENKIELFKNFRLVNLNFSIDGIGDKFHYMRFPGKWEEAFENMTKAKKMYEKSNNMWISWCITISALNIFDIENILEEHHKNFSNFGAYLNLVHYPKHFSLNFMPDDVKEKVIEKLNSIPKTYSNMWMQHLPGVINFIKNGSYNEHLWNEFKRRINLHDEYRNQDFTKIYPEYSKIIGLVK